MTERDVDTVRSSPASKGGVVSLEATFTVRAMKSLDVRARLENRGQWPILVLDRLWTLEGAKTPVRDPERCYRFVRGGLLRLLVGVCPLPRLKMATLKNLPHATRIAEGKGLDLAFTFEGPIGEYSFYFPAVSTSTTEKVHVGSVELLVQWIAERPGVETRPAMEEPAALDIATAGALDRPETARALSGKVELDVLRRTDEFDRLTLPGEKPEPLNLK